jgi:omega-amidase
MSSLVLTMNIALIQADLVWENKTANLAYFEAEITHIVAQSKKTGKKIDVLVLPEMFTTGFSMQPAPFAENVTDNMGENSPTLQAMRAWSVRLDALVIGSIMATENGKFYNRLLAVQPNGAFQYYDKRHLFAYANEDKHYTAGTEKLLIEWRGWRIMPLVCYDLRFPVWSRNTTDYDVLIYIANWPRPRALHWKTLLCARAIENQAYTIGVNRTGTDANNLQYMGNSAVINVDGTYVLELQDEKTTEIVHLDKDALMTFRKNLPFLKDRD